MRLQLVTQRLPMLPMRQLRICSHTLTCAICGPLEGIGSTPSEAERRAVAIFQEHVREYHPTTLDTHIREHEN